MSFRIQKLLVCPVTKQNLFPLDRAKTEFLHNALLEKSLFHVDGSELQADVDNLQFLMTENRHHVYSIVDEIPILIESKQIDLRQLQIDNAN